MNYRQVAELICRIAASWLIVGGLLGALAGATTFFSIRGPGTTSLFSWISLPTTGLLCGLALLILTRPCAYLLVPEGAENSWPPKALAISSIALVILVHCAQTTTSLLAVIGFQSLGLAGFRNWVTMPYLWFYFPGEAIALGFLIGTPYFVRRRLRPYEELDDEENV